MKVNIENGKLGKSLCYLGSLKNIMKRNNLEKNYHLNFDYPINIPR